MSKNILLTIVVSGEETIVVDREDYEAAKAAGELDHFLDAYISDVDTEATVIEPDGTELDPYL